MSSRVFRSRRVVTGGAMVPAAIHVDRGVITDVTAFDAVPEGTPLVDAGEHVILPGIVDAHVHLNEPGRTAWEGFRTATRAAARGGVTTLVDMPLNSIPATTSVASLDVKREAAGGQCHVDVGFWGGAIPGNDRELRAMLDAGALGFKCFMVPSGVDEFPFVDEPALRAAMSALAETNAPLLVHAELPGPIDEAEARVRSLDPRAYRTYLASRPAAAEDTAIALLVAAMRELHARVHVVHLSSASALETVLRAKDEGLRLSVETTPHYLHFAAEDVPDGATAYKCAPPIRERENRERLWSGLTSGLIDLVVSDHSPCTPDLKRLEAGDFQAAWGGIASLQLGLSLVWTDARRRGATLLDVTRWMCAGPAKLAGLSAKKGAIARGMDADLVVFDPDARRSIELAGLEHRHPITPYLGETVDGLVLATYLRGERIWDGETFTEARGALLGG
jgi:allantoinase